MNRCTWFGEILHEHVYLDNHTNPIDFEDQSQRSSQRTGLFGLFTITR